jgi:hypothetical protein
MNRLSTHIRGNAVGYVAVFLALSSGAYALGLQPDSVRSKHIKDGQVRSVDLADDSTGKALIGADVTNDSLTGQDVANDSLTGQDVTNDSLDGWDIHGLSFADMQANTLTGGQINESTLGAVPVATQGGTGRYGYDGSCDPESADFIDCSSVGIDLPSAGRVLVMGTVSAVPENDANTGIGDCRLDTSSGPIEASQQHIVVGRFEDGSFSNVTQWTGLSLFAVTNVLPAGSHTMRIECRQDQTLGAIAFDKARTVAVALGPG